MQESIVFISISLRERKGDGSEFSIHVTKIMVSWIHDISKFEESAPFSYRRHNCDVPERVVFWRIGSVLVQVSQIRLSITFWKHVCVRVSSEVYFAFISSRLSPNTKSSQIGIWCSGTRKCSKRYGIDHFCQGYFSVIQPSKSFPNPVGELSVLPIQCPIYRWHQAESWEVFGIGGWCVLSCSSIQISIFTVQA